MRNGQQQQAVWPPVEQDDTSDELHEHPWWQAINHDGPVPTSDEVAPALFAAEPEGPDKRRLGARNIFMPSAQDPEVMKKYI